MATLKKGGGKTRVCYFYDSDVRTAAARFQRRLVKYVLQ